MSQVLISAGQSLADVVLQTRGTLEGIFELADLNGLSITGALVPGQLLELPTTPAPAADVANYFADRSYRVNAGTTVEVGPPLTPHDFIPTDFIPTDLR